MPDCVVQLSAAAAAADADADASLRCASCGGGGVVALTPLLLLSLSLSSPRCPVAVYTPPDVSYQCQHQSTLRFAFQIVFPPSVNYEVLPYRQVLCV